MKCSVWQRVFGGVGKAHVNQVSSQSIGFNTSSEPREIAWLRSPSWFRAAHLPIAVAPMREAQARPARANPSDSSAALPPLPPRGTAAVRTIKGKAGLVHELFIHAFALGTQPLRPSCIACHFAPATSAVMTSPLLYGCGVRRTSLVKSNLFVKIIPRRDEGGPSRRPPSSACSG